eukprot:2109753-Prymnesium_polylepis.1
MFNAIWFVLVTFTTVGYGDIYPATAQGKLVAGISILLGILFTAMPITIMGQSFSDAWEVRTPGRPAPALASASPAR